MNMLQLLDGRMEQEMDLSSAAHKQEMAGKRSGLGAIPCPTGSSKRNVHRNICLCLFNRRCYMLSETLTEKHSLIREQLQKFRKFPVMAIIGRRLTFSFERVVHSERQILQIRTTD